MIQASIDEERVSPPQQETPKTRRTHRSSYNTLRGDDTAEPPKGTCQERRSGKERRGATMLGELSDGTEVYLACIENTQNTYKTDRRKLPNRRKAGSG